MGSVSSSYDVNGGTGKETGAGTARSRSRGDVAGTDARVDKLARLMTSHQKKRRHPGTAFHMEREDEEFDSDQVNLSCHHVAWAREDLGHVGPKLNTFLYVISKFVNTFNEKNMSILKQLA